MTSTPVSKPEKVAHKYEQRQNNFYDQTVAENNARLDAKIPAGDVRDEIKFIQSQMLAFWPD